MIRRIRVYGVIINLQSADISSIPGLKGDQVGLPPKNVTQIIPKYRSVETYIPFHQRRFRPTSSKQAVNTQGKLSKQVKSTGSKTNKPHRKSVVIRTDLSLMLHTGVDRNKKVSCTETLPPPRPTFFMCIQQLQQSHYNVVLLSRMGLITEQVEGAAQPVSLR